MTIVVVRRPPGLGAQLGFECEPRASETGQKRGTRDSQNPRGFPVVEIVERDKKKRLALLERQTHQARREFARPDGKRRGRHPQGLRGLRHGSGFARAGQNVAVKLDQGRVEPDREVGMRAVVAKPERSRQCRAHEIVGAVRAAGMSAHEGAGIAAEPRRHSVEIFAQFHTWILAAAVTKTRL